MSAQIFARLEFHTRIARRVPSGGAKVGGKQAAGGGGTQGNGSGNNIELSSTLPTSTSSASSPGLNFDDLLRTRIPSLQFVMPPPVLTFDPFEGEEERDGGGEGQEVELRVEDEDAEGEEAEEHPLGEKNEEGKLAEEGMRRVVGWREEVTVKGVALKSSLGLKMLDTRRSSFPAFFPRDPWSTNTPSSSPRPTFDINAETFVPEHPVPSSDSVPRRAARPPPPSSSPSPSNSESPFNIPLPAPPPPPDFACSPLDLLSVSLGVGLGLELANAQNDNAHGSSSPSSSNNSSYEDESEIETPLSLRHTVLLPTVSLSFTLPPVTLVPPPATKTLAVASSSSSSSHIDTENPFGFPLLQDAKSSFGGAIAANDVSEGESRALATTGGAGGRRRSWADVAAGKKEKRFCAFGFEE
ncbi:hypothetical protein BDY24DRAFT_140417 [Mrakia frigida]|uniref:uncharacterized protein n=1 Tax=Mrakia frigida TaxID=29902 RepID=UPI003FCC10E9